MLLAHNFLFLKAKCKLSPQGHAMIVVQATSKGQRVSNSIPCYLLSGVVRSALAFVMEDARLGQPCAVRSLWQTAAGWFVCSGLILLSLLVCLLLCLVLYQLRCVSASHPCQSKACCRDSGLVPRRWVVNCHSSCSPCQRLPGTAELTAGDLIS